MADLLEAFLADMQELKPSDGLVGQATSTINDISNREDEDYSCEAFVVSQNQIKDTSLNLPKVDHSVIQYDPFKRRFWDNPARDMKSWDDAQFNARLMKSISVLGLESPTMIQRRVGSFEYLVAAYLILYRPSHSYFKALMSLPWRRQVRGKHLLFCSL